MIIHAEVERSIGREIERNGYKGRKRGRKYLCSEKERHEGVTDIYRKIFSSYYVRRMYI